MNWPLLTAIIAGLLTCVFTAVNYALMDFSRLQLTDLLTRRGRGDRADTLINASDGILLLTSLARTLMNVLILGACMLMFAPPNEASSVHAIVLALGVAGLVIMVFGGAIPVSWARYGAEPLLARAMPTLYVLYRVTAPAMAPFHWLDPVVRRLLGVPKPTADDRSPVEQEILDAVSEGEKSGLVDEDQREMIEAVVEFPNITVEQIMTPRTDIEGITADSSLEDVKRFIGEAGHSRIPIYEGNLDHIVGVLYVKDLIPLLGDNGDTPFKLTDHLREAVFVPETKSLTNLLEQFKASKVHLAIVLDEYGGTAGLVTFEDVLEEIVGEIHDEYEPPEPEPSVDRIEDHIFEADGRVSIDELNDEAELSLPEDEDFDTVGGFVFATLGHIPDTGESFEYENLRITVTDAAKTRVNRVRIEVIDRAATESAEA
ncbi:MAG: DUF21 domain-containing protein [Phycisphaera sp.]|nr:DUF21 domain-containing protein [Phycisphaera sp.]